MAKYKELGDQLQDRIHKFTNFKIGKTGQSIQERYNEEYSSDYSHFEEIGYSDNSENIDKFEEYLIERFMHLKNCDNEQVGGGEMTKSDKYLVYLVYN